MRNVPLCAAGPSPKVILLVVESAFLFVANGLPPEICSGIVLFRLFEAHSELLGPSICGSVAITSLLVISKIR